MEFKDYYKTLGVAKDAKLDEIKKKYRLLARKYHPDVSDEPNAEEKFKEVREAYEVLKNDEKRAAYDQLGRKPQPGEEFYPPPGWEFHQQRGDGEFDPNMGAGASDFFESLFGQHAGGGRRSRADFQQRGQDQHFKINLTLEDAFHGGAHTLQLQEPQLDPTSGQMKMNTKSLKVKIPAGVTQDQHIRLAKQGSPGIGGAEKGDLYLEINLLPHKIYTVQGKDVYLNLPVTPWEAALGSKVEVPTLAGIIHLTIPPGSQTGKKLRLKGRGLPGKTSGDQYVILKIFIPEPKDDTQRQLYEEMAKQMHFNPRDTLMTRS